MKSLAVYLILLMPIMATAKVCQGPDIVVGFVGDILVHNDLYKSILPKKSFKPLWQSSISLFRKADFMLGNLEGPAALGITRDGQDLGDVGFTYDLNVYSGTNFLFNYHPQILKDLRESGFDLLTGANNHSLDRSWRGIDRTHEAAKKIGMPIVGTRPSGATTADMFHIANVSGLRLAFIGCTEMTNGVRDRKSQVQLCYSKNNSVESQIVRLRERSDIDGVIVLPHWGEEYQQSPNSRQESFAKAWLEVGAMAVVGSHPHVLQPAESYVTRDGRRTLIAYSLGNFLAFQAGVAKKTGVVLYLRISHNGRTAELEDVFYTPTYRDGYSVSPSSAGSAAEVEASRFFEQQKFLAPNQKIPDC